MLKTTYVLEMTIPHVAYNYSKFEEFDHHPTQNEVVNTMLEHKAISSHVVIRYDLIEEPKPQKVRINARVLVETAITEYQYRNPNRITAIFVASDVHQELVDDIKHIGRAIGKKSLPTLIQYAGIDVFEAPSLPHGEVKVSI
jgi:HJR/Mrr/RecB family endonuclease